MRLAHLRTPIPSDMTLQTFRVYCYDYVGIVTKVQACMDFCLSTPIESDEDEVLRARHTPDAVKNL